jgi:hypothetical protein
VLVIYQFIAVVAVRFTPSITSSVLNAVASSKQSSTNQKRSSRRTFNLLGRF